MELSIKTPRRAIAGDWIATSLLLIGFAAHPAAACGESVASEPIVITHDGQHVRNLIITASNGPGILIDGHADVVIEDVVILHGAGPGIEVTGARNTTIRNADILFTSAPVSGPNPSADANNIDCFDSPGLEVTNVRLTRGSTGIYLHRCPDSRLRQIEGHDQRGPFPRGQLVQWNASDRGVLSDFSTENSIEHSWTEDNVNVYRSRNVVIRRGLVDGNNSPSGDGILIDEESGHVLVERVDAVRQGNGCFGVFGGGGFDVTFRDTRCSDTLCQLPRGNPLSRSLGWAIDPESIAGNLNIIRGAYQRLCNPENRLWDEKMLRQHSLAEAAFTPRAPQRVTLCRYAYPR